MNPQEFEKLKEAARDFFKQTGLALEVDVENQTESTILVNVKADEPQFLIGEHGQTLSEIQRLLRAVLRKQSASPASFFVNVDINDYKKKKEEYLKEIAKNTADEVAIIKKEKELPAMSSFERRVIHAELSSRADVVTESVGEEPERRVIVKPRLS